MSDNEYIIFWKDTPGQQVATVVDAHNQPVRRDHEYINTQRVPLLYSEEDVFAELERAEGVRFAITVELARATLGWDI